MVYEPGPSVGLHMVPGKPPASNFRYPYFVCSPSRATIMVNAVVSREKNALTNSRKYPIIPWWKGHKALCCEAEVNSEVKVLSGLVSDGAFGGLLVLGINVVLIFLVGLCSNLPLLG